MAKIKITSVEGSDRVTTNKVATVQEPRTIQISHAKIDLVMTAVSMILTAVHANTPTKEAHHMVTAKVAEDMATVSATTDRVETHTATVSAMTVKVVVVTMTAKVAEVMATDGGSMTLEMLTVI